MYKSQIPFRSFDTLDKIEGKLAFEHLIAKFIFFKITILTDKSFPSSNFYNLHSLPSINTSHKRDERFFSPLSLSSSESDETEEQKFIFQIGTLNPKVLTNAFHSTNLFLFLSLLCSHQQRGSILCIEARLQPTFPPSPIYVINSVDNTNFFFLISRENIDNLIIG